MLKKLSVSLFIICSIVAISCSSQDKADLIIRGGKIVTMDDNNHSVDAIAIQNDKIIYVGSKGGILKYVGSDTKIIELKDELVLPGLIDAHGHLTGYGKSLENIDLVGTNSYDEVVKLVKKRIIDSDSTEWIEGRGWDQNTWDNKQFPTHQKLSTISPDNPVILSRVDGHAILVNQNAMDLAGITSVTPDTVGGKIYRDSKGNPTGVFVDNAEYLITNYIPSIAKEKLLNRIEKGAKSLTRYGITGIHDAGIPISRIADYKLLIDENKLAVRVNAMLSDTVVTNINQFLQTNKIESYGNDFLRVKSIKLYADGALGSRGAALLGPYNDDTANVGFIVTDSLHMLNVVQAALKSDFQVCTHAIGDRAIRTTLNIYEAALEKHPKSDHRFRIEHSQIIDFSDVPRYQELSVIPAMQPQHAVSDMMWTENRIGEDRAQGAFAFRSFIDDGNIIPCGSDCPVETPNPMLGIYNAVTRQDRNGSPAGGWIPEQKMTIDEVIKGYTIWAATAAIQEDILGTIEVGKYADLTILDKDIFTIDPIEILDTKPIYTIVGGEIKYQAD